MVSKPLISIAMATYNGARYLEQQLESIFRQSYQPLEVVVSDDCSSDGTVEILERYASLGKLKYIRNNANLGYVRNFQKVLGECTGELVALADQDDLWYENKIDRLYEAIGDNLLIHSDARLIDQDGKELADSFSRHSRKMTLPRSLTEACLNGSVTGCTTLLRRELLDMALPIPQGVYVHDKWLGLIAFMEGRFAYLDEALIGYRQHTGNSIGLADAAPSLAGKLLKVLKRRKIDFRTEAFREHLYKEKSMVAALRQQRKLDGIESRHLRSLAGFYNRVLEQTGLLGVLGYFLRNVASFECNKTPTQKGYYLYLVLCVFFHKKEKND